MLNRWNFLKTGFYEGIKLGTTPSDADYIETVYGVGYKFNEVRE